MEHVKIFIDDKEIYDVPLYLPLLIVPNGEFLYLRDEYVKCLIDYEKDKIIRNLLKED